MWVKKMKINFLISIVCALLLGYLCATFVFQEYKENETVFGLSNSIYFLQYGVYTNIDSADIKVDKYIDVEEDGKHYIYVGMTTSEENAKKIQDSYSEKNIELYVKQEYVSNNEFVSELSQYDILLSSSKTDEEMNSILSTVLSSYEEFVLGR